MNEITQDQQDAIDRCIESFKKLAEELNKLIQPIIENFIKIFAKVNKILYREHLYYKKYMMIYNRTKSKRIRKKQISLLRKKEFI